MISSKRTGHMLRPSLATANKQPPATSQYQRKHAKLYLKQQNGKNYKKPKRLPCLMCQSLLALDYWWSEQSCFFSGNISSISLIRSWVFVIISGAGYFAFFFWFPFCHAAFLSLLSMNTNFVFLLLVVRIPLLILCRFESTCRCLSSKRKHTYIHTHAHTAKHLHFHMTKRKTRKRIDYLFKSVHKSIIVSFCKQPKCVTTEEV